MNQSTKLVGGRRWLVFIEDEPRYILSLLLSYLRFFPSAPLLKEIKPLLSFYGFCSWFMYFWQFKNFSELFLFQLFLFLGTWGQSDTWVVCASCPLFPHSHSQHIFVINKESSRHLGCGDGNSSWNTLENDRFIKLISQLSIQSDTVSGKVFHSNPLQGYLIYRMLTCNYLIWFSHQPILWLERRGINRLAQDRTVRKSWTLITACTSDSKLELL